MKQIKNKLLVILGPTASGKSDLAIEIAKHFNGEIISADSRQIYQEMNIGTNKIKIEKINNQIYAKKIRHHLIDIINPKKTFSVAQYQKLALQAIKDIQQRNKLPILCGGTGLYLSALIENWQFPKIPAQSKFRQKLELKTLKELNLIYKKLDPQGTKLIDNKNKRRLIRAIEVCHFSKKSFWQQRKQEKIFDDILIIGLNPKKEELRKRIKKRANQMIKDGLEKEVRNLIAKYGWTPALQSIGYQEWKEYFNHQINKKEVQQLIELHTIQYAKRQLTWFKNQIFKKDFKAYWVFNKKKTFELIRKFLLE